MEATENMHP